MTRQFAVIGMGRVGRSLARTLSALGHEVLGIDANEDLIQDVSSQLRQVHLVAADVTDEGVLRDLGLEDFDGAAVVIGENVQASVLATLTLKDLGVPLVVARATTGLHARVLERVGADRIVQPERQAGELIARSMASPGVKEYLDLGEDEAIVELEVPKKWVGKTLADLQLPRRTGLTVLVLRARGKKGTIPSGDAVLQEGDVLVLGGSKEDIDRSELFRY